VLYVPSSSSTIGSFVRAYALRRHAPRAAHGMVALIPRRHRAAERPILHGTAPDVLFVGSYRSLLHTHLLSLNGDLIPAGVDASAYRPPRVGERDALRETLGVEAGSYVYLHVGCIGPQRNLERLAALAETPGASVILVAIAPPADQNLQSRLERAGVRVVHGPVTVAEYFRAADCYVFPVEDHGEEAEIPIGVYEALASGVPVVSTPFGGLRDFLPPGDDLRYIESDDELLAAVSQFREHTAPAVRSMDDFSWERVSQRIVETLEA
jgi:glycosyltransferase involved in cell wall biosynthesis